MAGEDADYCRKREAQELKASERAKDPTIKRLHWEMAQRYAYLAKEAEESGEANETTALPAGKASFEAKRAQRVRT